MDIRLSYLEDIAPDAKALLLRLQAAVDEVEAALAALPAAVDAGCRAVFERTNAASPADIRESLAIDLAAKTATMIVEPCKDLQFARLRRVIDGA